MRPINNEETGTPHKLRKIETAPPPQKKKEIDTIHFPPSDNGNGDDDDEIRHGQVSEVFLVVFFRGRSNEVGATLALNL